MLSCARKETEHCLFMLTDKEAEHRLLTLDSLLPWRGGGMTQQAKFFQTENAGKVCERVCVMRGEAWTLTHH